MLPKNSRHNLPLCQWDGIRQDIDLDANLIEAYPLESRTRFDLTYRKYPFSSIDGSRRERLHMVYIIETREHQPRRALSLT